MITINEILSLRKISFIIFDLIKPKNNKKNNGSKYFW